LENIFSEIDALILLLDDPDDAIYHQVVQRFHEIGRPAIFSLEKKWNIFPSPIFQERVENLIHDIHIQWVRTKLKQWIEVDSLNLKRGAYLISTLQYPELEESDLDSYFNELQKDVSYEVNFDLTPLEKIRAFNHIFFEIHRFSGNYSNYYSPFNNYINYVFENRSGNPLSLSIIYSIVAQQLGIPIYGINLPRNFVLAWLDNKGEVNQNVCFYINPFNRGIVLGRHEIDLFLHQQNIIQQDTYYSPCNNSVIIRRLLLNLITAYEKLGNTQRSDELNLLLKLFDKD